VSHEGIRIVSEAESKRIEAEDARTFPPEATAPARVRVRITEGTGVEIEWKDGHLSHWTFQYLRDACPCATCHEAREAAGIAPGQRKPSPTQLLPMYVAPIKPLESTPVGRYALRFKWNDGHESGIYSWEYLRRSCRCFVCRAELGLE